VVKRLWRFGSSGMMGILVVGGMLSRPRIDLGEIRSIDGAAKAWHPLDGLSRIGIIKDLARLALPEGTQGLAEMRMLRSQDGDGEQGGINGIIRDASCLHAKKRCAVETLGMVVNQCFHHAADPVGAAESWLRQRGQ